MSPQPEIKPEDCHFVSLAAFAREEKLALRTIKHHKANDARFPAPRYGARYWKPDLLPASVAPLQR